MANRVFVVYMNLMANSWSMMWRILRHTVVLSKDLLIVEQTSVLGTGECRGTTSATGLSSCCKGIVGKTL